MKVAFFDARTYDRVFFQSANAHHGHEIIFIEARLHDLTAELAKGCDAVCAFVNDRLSASVLESLSSNGTKIIALRSAGYNHVDLDAAAKLNLPIVRVPEYSPYAVAEHAITLLLTLNRKIHRANARVHELNFSLEGLVGFDLHGKTVGVFGTGRIGQAFARIAVGFGCQVLACDPQIDPKLVSMGVRYVSFEELCRSSDVISLHAPLVPETRHVFDQKAFARMKDGAYLINTSRGALIDTPALVESLKSGRLAGAGLDVYEEEENVFFRDLSDQVLQDDVLARLLTFPNVLITSHQAFLTKEALHNIASTTLESLTAFASGHPLIHAVRKP